ncbi:MAG: carbamoyltransferase [Deltaproteobacteria bacterium]|nr:carbamoyltransferase [Deltaproteobacteria bacterium]
MDVLGISAFYHDAAACLLRDGEIVAAASEERFTRKKHDADFPENAIKYVLQEGRVRADDLAYVGFYEKPFVKFKRILFTHLACFPMSLKPFLKAIPSWLQEKLLIPSIIRQNLGYEGEVLMIEHHLSHAASAYLLSPFREAAILTVDGVGEWSTATYGRGKDNAIDLFKEIRFPHSLGLLYSAFTYYLGFTVNSAEYKVMGLAPYGEPRYVDQIYKLIEVRDDGSFHLDMRYFNYLSGLTMTNRKFDELFGGPPRAAEGAMEQRHKDLAASVQRVTEDVMLRMANHLGRVTGSRNLCLAGGVALNCVANGRILREGPFDELFVQPAAGDAGGAIGVASYIYHTLLENKRSFVMRHAFTGPGYNDEEVRSFLDLNEIPYVPLERDELLRRVAQLIADQQVVGWFQGRMEFGPRALGNRSILADPRNAENRDRVNLKIKFRESFRPFAPAILKERCKEYFELDSESPFMLLVAQVRPDHRVIPSVTHVDGSARVQTVDRESNPLFYDLIQAFDAITGVPVLINTSFNVRGEPIVCTPADAYRCFVETGMDVLVLGNFFLDKSKDLPRIASIDWDRPFQPD